MNLNDYASQCHEDNKKWWQDPVTGADFTEGYKESLKPVKILLMHSELSEMAEGVRKGLMDDHLPHLTSEAVELADLFIRAFDYAAAFGIDIQTAYTEKRAYNKQRADHTHAYRVSVGGKKW